MYDDIECVESGYTESQCAELCCKQGYACKGYDFQPDIGRCCTRSVTRVDGQFEENVYTPSMRSCEKNSETQNSINNSPVPYSFEPCDYTGSTGRICASFVLECEGLFERRGERWCVREPYGIDSCCGSTGDCCEPMIGPIVGIVLAIVVVLAASITGCAYCCKCCCFSRPPQQPVSVVMGQVPPVHGQVIAPMK